jgi:hypothetical protein
MLADSKTAVTLRELITPRCALALVVGFIVLMPLKIKAGEICHGRQECL